MAIFRVPARIEIAGLQGGPFMNVFNVRTIGPSGDDADQLGDALDALETFYTGFIARMPNTTTITLGEGMIKDPLGAPEYQEDDPRVLVAGGVAAGTATPLLALVVSWRTASASRSGRGRTFCGPFNPSTVGSDGTPDNALVTSVSNAAAALVAASGGPNGWSLGVLSTKQALLRDVTGSTVRDRWSYLSSRRD